MRWIGDDCAVVRAGGYAAVSVDVMVDGTHFRLGARRHARGRRAGARSRARCPTSPRWAPSPGEAYLAVVLPPGMGDEDVLALHRGAEALRRALRA